MLEVAYARATKDSNRHARLQQYVWYSHEPKHLAVFAIGSLVFWSFGRAPSQDPNVTTVCTRIPLKFGVRAVGLPVVFECVVHTQIRVV